MPEVRVHHHHANDQQVVVVELTLPLGKHITDQRLVATGTQVRAGNSEIGTVTEAVDDEAGGILLFIRCTCRNCGIPSVF